MKINKIIGLILLIIAIVCIVTMIVLVVINQNSSVNTSNQVVSEKMTLEKFNKINMGMTYEQTVSIIGEEGTIMSENNIGNDEQYHTIMYYWYSNDGVSNANVTFQGGKVVSKAQVGL